MSFTIRFATEDDASTILQFIIALAKYEQLEHEVVATEDLLKETLFGARPQAETLLAVENETAVGFAIFFSNYSTFLGRAGIHLEDLFVLEAFRGRGYGKALLDKMQDIAQAYGLTLSPGEQEMTLAEFVSLRVGGHPVVGDDVDWHGIHWVVSEMEGGDITRVGLRLY